MPPPSSPAAPETAAAPAKSKKRLLIVLAVVLVLLAAAGGGAAWIMYQRSHAPLDDETGTVQSHKAEPPAPPTYLPLENMVVNLADPGGDRFAQIGITLELSDPKTAEQVKQYLPTIRNAILLLISQRTSDELLQREGKEALAEDIRREVSRPLGYALPAKKGASAARSDADNPVRRVLFSSFIIQ